MKKYLKIVKLLHVYVQTYYVLYRVKNYYNIKNVLLNVISGKYGITTNDAHLDVF